MKFIFTQMRRFFERVPNSVRRHRVKMWAGFILLTVVMIAGMPGIKMDASLISTFEKDDPVKFAYDDFRDVFGSDEVLYLVYEAKDGDVFSAKSIRAMQAVEADLLNYRRHLKADDSSPLDHITKVTSLSSVSYLEATEGTLISRDFIGTNLPENKQEKETLIKRAENQPDYLKVYYSKDHRYGGIVVETDFNAVPEDSNSAELSFKSSGSLDDDDVAEEVVEMASGETKKVLKFKQNLMVEYVPFMAAVSEIINKAEYTDHLTFYAVGTPPWNSFINTMVKDEMGFIILGALMLITLFTGVLFRSLSAVIWQVLIVVVSLIWVMGTVGWSGLVMSDLIMMIAFFVLAVGVADSIHILSGYLFFSNQNKNHFEALQSVYKKSGLACFLTSVTTAIGFISMLFIPIASMQKIGLFSAVGVFYAFIITVFMFPLMLDLWSPVSKKQPATPHDQTRKPHFIQKIIQKGETYLFQYPALIIVFFIIAGIVLFAGSFNVRVESATIKVIRSELPVRKAFDLADDVMAGTQNIEVLVDTGRANGMKDPRVLKTIDSFQRHMEKSFPDSVTSTMSLTNVTKDSYKALHGGDKSKYIIPDGADDSAQTIFLFDNANPVDRRRLVSDNYQTGRIIIRTKSMGSMRNLDLIRTTEEFVEKNITPLKAKYPDLDITLTGQVPLLLKVFDYLSWSFIISFFITITVVSVILFIVLNSFKLGLFAIIPNILPVITVLGVMGYFDIPLDIHTLMVVPILIGIAVDDTIHFLTHFQLEMQNHGDTRRAVMNSSREAGQAIILTSLVLSIGFLMFTTSSNLGFVYFGLLNAIAILTAVIADLVLLPVILNTHIKTVPLPAENEMVGVEI